VLSGVDEKPLNTFSSHVASLEFRQSVIELDFGVQEFQQRGDVHAVERFDALAKSIDVLLRHRFGQYLLRRRSAFWCGPKASAAVVRKRQSLASTPLREGKRANLGAAAARRTQAAVTRASVARWQHLCTAGS
jgi:hypothetical protein